MVLINGMMIVGLKAKLICKHIHDINVVPNYEEGKTFKNVIK